MVRLECLHRHKALGQADMLLLLLLITRTGYTFGGWFPTSSCVGSPVNFSTYAINSNQTFYAKWVPIPGIDYTFYNNSSFYLDFYTVDLSGKIGSNNYTTYFISDYQGEWLPPNSDVSGSGIDISEPAGTGISNLYLEVHMITRAQFPVNSTVLT